MQVQITLFLEAFSLALDIPLFPMIVACDRFSVFDLRADENVSAIPLEGSYHSFIYEQDLFCLSVEIHTFLCVLFVGSLFQECLEFIEVRI